MSFAYPLLLAGLVFVGVPVLLHLIMRQQPKHLAFPAMRFLIQRHRTNQRKMQLRHFLLLALRMLLLAAICLAFARPKLFSERLNLTGKRPVAAVLLFDTSPSMEFRLGDDSRLDEAKRRGLELINDIPEGSRVAVLDTQLGGDWQPSIEEARRRVSELRIQPASGPLTSQVRLAYDLLDKVNQGHDNPASALLPFLYVFSDRTAGSWSGNQLNNLLRRKEQMPIPAHAAFVDVGKDDSEEVALIDLKIGGGLATAGAKLQIQALARAHGKESDVEILCLVDGERVGHLSRKLPADVVEVFVFETDGLEPGLHQIEARIVTNLDPVPLRYARYLTIEVQGRRRVLTVSDEPDDAYFWDAALRAGKDRAFEVETITPGDLARVEPKVLAAYDAVTLFNVKKPSKLLWRQLKAYVESGGGLAIVPGADLDAAFYREDAADLLPAAYVDKTKRDDKGVRWQTSTSRHPIMGQFREWSLQPSTDFVKFPRSTFQFWTVSPYPGQHGVLVSYTDEKGQPALLERRVGRGRVVLFTTTFDGGTPLWNNYLEKLTSFYPVLAHVVMGFLAGGADVGEFNYYCGQAVTVPLPASPRYSTYILRGPGIEGTAGVVQRHDDASELRITQAVEPGNFALLGGQGGNLQQTAAFSMNVPPDEFLFTRVPAHDIEALLGADAVLALGADDSLKMALDQRWQQPIELFPWLMMLVLVALAVENLLANRFYRKTSGDADSDEIAPTKESELAPTEPSATS